MTRSRDRADSTPTLPGARAAALAGLLLALAAPPALAASADDAQRDANRARMRTVFDALSVLLPLSLDEQKFSDPANQAKIAEATTRLVGAAEAVSHHGGERDASFRVLSRSLAADVAEIQHRYAWNRLEESRFFVLETTRNCVACHARLPSDSDFDLGAQLTRGVDPSQLSVHERTQLYVATRQFDPALTTWEELFASKETTPSQLDIGGYLLDYLTVSVRVRRDAERARKGLAIVQGRKDLPRYMDRRLTHWRSDLESLAPVLRAEPQLDQARALVRWRAPEADVYDEYDRLIRDLVASSLLHRLLDAPPADFSEAQLAEASYLLGVVEVRNVDSFWVPLAEHHLETAIRIDPNSPVAERAWILLEQYTAVGYGGTDAVTLPADVWSRLEELRQLVHQSNAAPNQLE